MKGFGKIFLLFFLFNFVQINADIFQHVTGIVGPEEPATSLASEEDVPGLATLTAKPTPSVIKKSHDPTGLTTLIPKEGEFIPGFVKGALLEGAEISAREGGKVMQDVTPQIRESLKQLEGIGKVGDVFLEPVVALFEPLPLIPLATADMLTAGQVPGFSTFTEIFTEVGTIFHIRGLQQRYQKARRKFDRMTKYRYRTKKEIEGIKDKAEREKKDPLGIVSKIVGTVASPMAKLFETALDPLKEVTQILEKEGSPLIKPVEELAYMLPPIPFVGVIKRFQLAVFLRGLQQRATIIEKVLDNKLRSSSEDTKEMIKLKEVKKAKGGNALLREINQIVAIAQHATQSIRELMDELTNFPISLGLLMWAGTAVTTVAMDVGETIAKATGVGAPIGIAIKGTKSIIKSSTIKMLFRAYVRNLQYLYDRLEREIAKEQKRRGHRYIIRTQTREELVGKKALKDKREAQIADIRKRYGIKDADTTEIEEVEEGQEQDLEVVPGLEMVEDTSPEPLELF